MTTNSKLGKIIFYTIVLLISLLLIILTILFFMREKEPWGLPIIDNKDIVQVDQNELYIQQGLHLVLSIHEIRQKIIKSKNNKDKIIEICKEMIIKNDFVSIKKSDVYYFQFFHVLKKDSNQNFSDPFLLGNDFIFMLIKELDSIVNIGSKETEVNSILKYFYFPDKLLEDDQLFLKNTDKSDPNFMTVYDFVNVKNLTISSLKKKFFVNVFEKIEKSQFNFFSKKSSNPVVYPRYLFVNRIDISEITHNYFGVILHKYIYRLDSMVVYNNKSNKISLFSVRKNKIYEIKNNSSIVVVQDLKKLIYCLNKKQKNNKNSDDLENFLNIFRDKENIKILNVYAKSDFAIQVLN